MKIGTFAARICAVRSLTSLLVSAFSAAGSL